PPAGRGLVSPRMWRPNTRRELRPLTRDGEAMYLVTSPFEMGVGASVAVPPGVHDLAPVGSVVYDLIPFQFADHYLTDPTEAARYHAHRTLMNESDLLCALSAFTQQEVITKLGIPPERVVSIGAGVPEGFRPAEPDAPLPGLVHHAVP